MSRSTDVPPARIRGANDRELRADGDYVLYWMIAARRARWNFALQRAAWWARELGRPLVVLEALRADYRWASDRLHRFVIDGMADNAEAFARSGALYWPYVERKRGTGKGLLAQLAGRASVVVTDEFPAFFLPRMVAAAARQIPVRLEVVDGNGLLPLSASDRVFSVAAHFRRWAQGVLLEHLGAFPVADPLARAQLPRLAGLPAALRRRWPAAGADLLAGSAAELRALPIDHAVPPVAMRGGATAAGSALRRFVAKRLGRYHVNHNEPEADATSRLSPYLHFGHVSAHEVFAAVARHEAWSLSDLDPKPTGSRAGWWGVGPGAEAFLDQLVVWRELGYHNAARQGDAYGRYGSLPEWARATLREHARDPRPNSYRRRDLEQARTHDPLWNAAQGQLRREGWYHNYMRMLWGKKILEWSETPRAALGHMEAIMNRWSLDGRNPNSYTGYHWVLGRYDRPWFERPVFGKVRTMTSRSVARRLDVDGYIARFAGPAQAGEDGGGARGRRKARRTPSPAIGNDADESARD